MSTNKQPTSFRLSDAALDLLEQLAEKLGLSQASVIEMLLREKAEEKKIKPRKDRS